MKISPRVRDIIETAKKAGFILNPERVLRNGHIEVSVLDTQGRRWKSNLPSTPSCTRTHNYVKDLRRSQREIPIPIGEPAMSKLTPEDLQNRVRNTLIRLKEGWVLKSRYRSGTHQTVYYFSTEGSLSTANYFPESVFNELRNLGYIKEEVMDGNTRVYGLTSEGVRAADVLVNARQAEVIRTVQAQSEQPARPTQPDYPVVPQSTEEVSTEAGQPLFDKEGSELTMSEMKALQGLLQVTEVKELLRMALSDKVKALKRELETYEALLEKV